MATRIAIGEAREQLRLIPDESINCCVTSPPYWLTAQLPGWPKGDWQRADDPSLHR